MKYAYWLTTCWNEKTDRLFFLSAYLERLQRGFSPRCEDLCKHLVSFLCMYLCVRLQSLASTELLSLSLLLHIYSTRDVKTVLSWVRNDMQRNVSNGVLLLFP